MRRRQPRVSAVRQSIRSAVEQNPGIHFRGLARAAQVTSAGQLRHHLDKLERDGDVVEVEDGRYRRFFVAGQHEPKVRAEMARFARVVPRRIARLLLDSPMNRTQLRRSLRCADSTLGYHLSRMVMLGDLARIRGPQSCVYSLTREDEVRRMLLVQGADDSPPTPPESSQDPRFDEEAQGSPAAGPPTLFQEAAPELPFPQRAEGLDRSPEPSPEPERNDLFAAQGADLPDKRDGVPQGDRLTE